MRITHRSITTGGIQRFKRNLDNVHNAALAALESAHEQMSQCEKMFRDDAEFVTALEEVRAVLRSHGRIS